MSYETQNTAVRTAILAFTSELKTQLQNASSADYAANSGKLEGLTLNEVVELIAGTTGLTIQDVQDSLDTFIARSDNPHGVTATQVGLGLVDNFATATDVEGAGIGYNYVATNGQTAFSGADKNTDVMELSSSAIVYVELNGNRVGDANYTSDVSNDTVTLATAAASDAYSYTATSGQTDFSGSDDAAAVLTIEPGQKIDVTKNGVALVPNTDFTVDRTANVLTLTTGAAASDTIAITASDQVVIRVVVSDKFMTTQVLWHVMDAFWAQKVGSAPGTLDTIEELAAALDSNPDIIDNLTQQIAAKADQADIDASIAALTSASVGLGNVQNYAVATNLEAVNGLATDKYMTPALTKAHTDAVASGLQSQIDAKVAQADIDAAVAALTAIDVGLGNLSNFATATVAQTVTGTATNLFVTPAGVKGVRDVMEIDTASALTSIETAFNDALADLQAP